MVSSSNPTFLETHFCPDLHRRACRQVSPAHRIISRAGEARDPVHLRESAMPQLAHKRNRTAFGGYRILTLLILLGVVCIPAFTQGASSNPFMNLWNQQTLTGDWGGARTRLSEKGISFTGFWQNDY